MFRERFTSRVKPDPAGRRIDVTYAEGPFKYLENHWVFEDPPQGCLIDFYVDFEFRSKLLQKVIEGLFHEAVRRMVRAFATRANQLYGPGERVASSRAATPHSLREPPPPPPRKLAAPPHIGTATG